jgi:hypothetical protein
MSLPANPAPEHTSIKKKKEPVGRFGGSMSAVAIMVNVSGDCDGDVRELVNSLQRNMEDKVPEPVTLQQNPELLERAVSAASATRVQSLSRNAVVINSSNLAHAIAPITGFMICCTSHPSAVPYVQSRRVFNL